jgi:hypothetical protein
MAETRFGHIDQLPDEVRDVFTELCQETANLGMKWRFYLDLFGDPEDLALLHDTANGAFLMIEQSLRVDMTMTICRLADPLKSMGKANLSFAKLAEHFAGDAILQAIIKRFLAAAKPVVESRNKLIGHNDLNTKLKPSESLLSPFGRSDIQKIVDNAAEALNRVGVTHANASFSFEPAVLGGGKSLLKWLRIGFESWNQKR